MATAVKSQVLPASGASKPPVPPKPSGDGNQGTSKKRGHLASSSSPSPPPPSTPPPPHLQALILSEQAKNRNVDQPSTSGAADAGPSKSPTPAASTNVKRSQSQNIQMKNYVLKPLRLHHSFQEKQKTKRPLISKRSKGEGESSSLTDWFCLPISSFVVKTKAGGSALVEKGTKKLFGKGPPPPKKLKRPAPQPPKSAGSSPITSKPRVPPRPVLRKILAGISNGEKEGIWYKLENVKYIDENDSTEDSTDYTDVDWSQALWVEPGEETIIYYTYVQESPNETVVFYKRVVRDDLLSSSDGEGSHVAEMEDSDVEMEITDDEIGVENGIENVENDVEVEERVENGIEKVEDVRRVESPVEITITEYPVDVEVVEIPVEVKKVPRKMKKPPPPRPPSPKVIVVDVIEEPRITSESGLASVAEGDQEPVEEEEEERKILNTDVVNREFIANDDRESVSVENQNQNLHDESKEIASDDVGDELDERNKEIIDENQEIVVDIVPEVEKSTKIVKESVQKEKDPQYASVQKVLSTSTDSAQKSDYYDLDVPSSPKTKVKPKRPPPPSQPPPPPPRLVPPPIPPKTYMKIKFPPQPQAGDDVVEVKEDNINFVEITQVDVEMTTPEVDEKKEINVELEPDHEIKPENAEKLDVVDEEKVVEEQFVEDFVVQDLFAVPSVDEPQETDIVFDDILSPRQQLSSSIDNSRPSLSPTEDEKPRRSDSIPSGITSESGFLSSPTPPPRHRKKRFRSADGPSRSSTAQSPIRRSKSCSDADNSRPPSSASGVRTLTRDMSTNTTPERPPRPRPALKPKPRCPERPPRPGPASLKKLIKTQSQTTVSTADSDVTSLSPDGSPVPERMKDRPLPPPPTPVRHRNVSKGKDKPETPGGEVAESKGTLNFPMEFFTKLSEIEAGKLNLTEINVKKINVQEIDAAHIRVGSMQVGVLMPLSDRRGSGDSGGSRDKSESGDKPPPPDDGKKDVSETEDSQKPDWFEKLEKMDKFDKSEPPSEDSTLIEDGNPKKIQVIDRLIVSPVPIPGGLGSSVFYTDVKDEDDKTKSPKTAGSPTLSQKSTSSESSGKNNKKKSSEKKTSWYDEGVIPGQAGDVDTSDGRAEGGVESPFQEATTTVFHLGSSGRKKTGRIGRGSLQLQPREQSPSSSSTTDVDDSDSKSGRHHHHRLLGRTRSLSAGNSRSPSTPEVRIPRMQLDPNANYFEGPPEDDQLVNPNPDPGNLNLPDCTGDGRCGTPETPGGSDSTIDCGKESAKRFSIQSLQTSEDSWYNCTSGDESETETSSNSFLTAQSCADDVSSASSSVAEHRQSKKFLIAKELMTSEKVFVDTLKLLNEDFRDAVIQANVLPKSIIDQMFNYLPQLQDLNQDLLKDLTERINNWDEAGRIADVITKKGPFLKLYSSYIKDFKGLMAILDDACKKYPAFSQVVKEFEMSPRCNKLAIKHYMLKPVQRIPQYRLLLGDYLKHLTINSPEYDETVAALTIVSDVANHANQTMKQGDNFAKLLQIQNNIIGDHEIIRPGRTFIKEGELCKLSRKVMQPRWFILFNDVLLHTDVIQMGSYRLHHELPLLGMRVTVPSNEDYLNEFSIISNTRSFILSASSPLERDQWIKALTDAITTNTQRRGTFAGSKGSKGQAEETVSDAMLGNQAPVWIPDSRVTMCQICTAPFTVTFRRHHCRACGKVVCAPCSSNKAPLQYQQYQCGRVCDICFPMLAEAFNPLEETDSRANLRSQFKKFTGNGKKAGRRLPQVLKEVGANHQGAAISGYLQKKVKKTWRRYWFVLNEKVLYSYKASEDVAALESIPLLGFQLKPCSELFENADPKLGFQLDHPSHQSIMFYAENEATVEKWKKEMHSATLLE